MSDEDLPEVAEEVERTVGAAIKSWPTTIRLGVLCLFTAGSFAAYHLATHSSREESPQCRFDVVVHQPGKGGGQQRA